MDANRDTSTGDVSRSDAGTPTSRLSSSPAEQTNQGYVPPELRPTGQSYSGAGEPTRQWSGPPPPPQNPPPPYPYSAPPPPPPPPQPYARGRDWRDGRNRRAPLLGPFLLITAGVVFLLNNLNVLPWSIWNQLWRLWPLILILVGLEILLGRRSPALSFILILVVLAAGVGFVYANGGLRDAGNATPTSLAVPLGGASKGDVRIQMGAGELNVDGSGDVGAGQLASGNLGYFENQSKPKQSTSVSSGTVQLTLMQGDSNGSPWSFFGPHNGTLTWDVHLSPEVPMKLRVETGAGNGDLDLEKLKITDLTVKRGAGNVTLTLPSSGSTTGTIDGGVGNLDLVVPEGVAARLKVKIGIGNIDVDKSSFTKQGDDTYQSPNYSSDAKNRVDLTLDAGIGNVNVRTK